MTDFNTGPLEDSKKSYYKEFKKVVEASDVVIQVLDARDPLGCRCPQLEELIMGSGKTKKLVLLLNKIDLIPKDIAEKWLKYLRNEYPAIAFKSSTQTQRQKLVSLYFICVTQMLNLRLKQVFIPWDNILEVCLFFSLNRRYQSILQQKNY